MNNLLRFIRKYHFIMLFLILEGFSVGLLVNGSYYQKARLGSGLRSITASIYNQLNNLKQYLRLQQTNIELASENVNLRNEIAVLRSQLESLGSAEIDSVHTPGYLFRSARVVNNAVTKRQNFITLNVGANHGVSPEMGVVSGDGVVGIISAVSKNYATAISLLNVNFRLSAKHKPTGFFGSLYWDGADFRRVILTEIPQHVNLAVGDTIVTSGYSAIFPPDIPIGTIEKFSLREGAFYTINVRLISDFKKLDYVSVIEAVAAKERTEIELR